MENIIYKNKKAVAILRVSSVRQEDGISHQVQEKKSQEYCNENGLDLVKIFVITESAKDTDDRKQYHEAMAFILKNKYGNVIFYAPDREARNATDLEQNEKWVKAEFFNIHYLTEKLIMHRSSPDSDWLKRDLYGLVSRNFVRNLSTKVVDAMEAKAATGWYPSSHPPLGYICEKARDIETGRIKNRGGTISVDVNANNIKVVRREFELRANGLSYEEIKKTIISEGLVTGKKVFSYRKGTIEKRLNNPFYRGKFLWKGKLYQGNHEIIINKEWLDKVDSLSGKWGFKKRHFGNEYMTLADGWMKCTCGCRVIYDPKQKTNKTTGDIKTYHYYRCTNGKNAHEKLVNINAPKIWEQFGELIDKVSISEEFAKDIADALNATEKKAHKATEIQMADFKANLKQLEDHENKLFDLRIQGNINQEDFNKQLARIRTNRDGLTDQLETLQKGLTSAVMETGLSQI